MTSSMLSTGRSSSAGGDVRRSALHSTGCSPRSSVLSLGSIQAIRLAEVPAELPEGPHEEHAGGLGRSPHEGATSRRRERLRHDLQARSGGQPHSYTSIQWNGW